MRYGGDAGSNGLAEGKMQDLIATMAGVTFTMQRSQT